MLKRLLAVTFNTEKSFLRDKNNIFKYSVMHDSTPFINRQVLLFLVNKVEYNIFSKDTIPCMHACIQI